MDAAFRSGLTLALALAILASCKPQEALPPAPRSEEITPVRAISQAKDPGPVAKGADGEVIDCKNGQETTYWLNMCSGYELAKAEFELRTYLEVARKTIAAQAKDAVNQGPEPDFDTKGALLAFDKAQAAWETFVNSKCDAAHGYFASGTIHGHSYARCYLRETKLRTLGVWKDWLTYRDSTPPRLPRPDIDPSFIGRNWDTH